MQRIWLFLFFLAALANLFGEHYEVAGLALASKPLLMPLLGLWFYQVAPASPLKPWLMAAVAASWGGDVLLMMVEHGPGRAEFFLAGLGSFLIAQVSYGVAFWKAAAKGGALAGKPWAAWPFLLYLLAILGYLWPGLEPGLRAPVAVYALAITVMAALAYNLKTVWAQPRFWGLMAGVAFFLLSDSLIAINKFAHPVPASRLLIMSTYIAAQYLILRAAARQAPA